MPVQYTDLVNKSGTIYNTKTNTGYANPDLLAKDLGISSNAINWGSIKSDAKWSPTSTASTQSSSPQVFSFMNEQASYDPATGITKVINPTPNSNVTNSSSIVDEAVKNLGNNINKASSSTFDINSLLESFRQTDANSKKTSEDLNKFYEQRQADLEQRKKDELARLDAEYNTESAKKEVDYTKAVEPYQKRLQLLKDTPYGTNATLEEELKLKLSGLEQTHKLEMDTLFNKRQSSIALAQSAYEDKDFALAESQIKNAKETEKLLYERQQDFLTMTLKLQEEERQRQKAEYEQMKDSRDFMMKYDIKQPMFAIGGTVFNSQTLQPEYENVNGEFRRISDGKVYENEQDFFVDTGLKSFGQIQDIVEGSATEQKIVLDLIKDYPDAKIYPGMSLEQAYNQLNSSAKYKKEIRVTGGEGDGSIPSDSKVKNTLYQIKQNSSGSWYDQWGEAADYLKSEGLNPNNYDKLFWEIFHPEGSKGYDEYVKNEGFE